VKKLYYKAMYEFTDAMQWLTVENRERWSYWWNVSERYRIKRDSA
jgi:hypothetical protein